VARELKGSRTPKSWRGAFVSIISADGFGYNSGGKLNCQLPVCIEQFFLRCIESTQKMPSALPLPRRLTRVYSICPSFFFLYSLLDSVLPNDYNLVLFTIWFVTRWIRLSLTRHALESQDDVPKIHELLTQGSCQDINTTIRLNQVFICVCVY